jgi:hypothetical protein
MGGGSSVARWQPSHLPENPSRPSNRPRNAITAKKIPASDAAATIASAQPSIGYHLQKQVS